MSRKILAFAAAVSASNGVEYSQHGSNWPSLNLGNELNQCGSTTQSPINLIMPENHGDLLYSQYPLYEARIDEVQIDFKDLTNVKVDNNGHTT